jgi:guanosine-3',5'-bis(diphosphate) 3'-pyrophosphohydrolase
MVDYHTEQEKRQIVNAYRSLLRASKPFINHEDKQDIRKAFNFALDAHRGMRRRSGELYIFHPLAVATICAKEINLGATSIISAFLHDVVEDTETTPDDIEATFGTRVARIINGLTKISDVSGHTKSMQAENFRKILLTLSDDVRVILIKLADRLHNMRTLEAIPARKQLKIASETLEVYAPLAHRLGLYSIKSELEDLALKYTEPEVYHEIVEKLTSNKSQRNRFIRKFTLPLHKKLNELGFNYEIKGRTKSIYSIYRKMKNQGIPFEEVYDVFAIRVILEAPEEQEKQYCWRTYSVITDTYTPNPNRLRDWISTPKANGYEALHTTVMGPLGKWVEVQIRSRRMDEIAEKGFAAHWKYKENAFQKDSRLDEWLHRVRETLENPSVSAIDFLDEFKLNLFSDEVFVFTPNGDLIKLPLNATALDFAFEIHTEVGLLCFGAKVNRKLVPLDYKLKSGDQVEILTSKKQKPNPEWLEYVVTAKAKSKIKATLKDEKRQSSQLGKEILERKFRYHNINPETHTLNAFTTYMEEETSLDLFYGIAQGRISQEDLNTGIARFIQGKNLQTHQKVNGEEAEQESDQSLELSPFDKGEVIFEGGEQNYHYTFAKCCNPIPGDDIFGFITKKNDVKVHRTNCSNGIHLMSKFGSRILNAEWGASEIKPVSAFPVGLQILGIDSLGIVSKITDIISKELQVNMDSITISAKAGAFEGSIILYIYNTKHLERLIEHLAEQEGIESVHRFNPDFYQQQNEQSEQPANM